MLKNIKPWEWVLIVVTCVIMFGHNALIESIREKFSYADSDELGGKRVRGQRGWLRNLIQAIAGELPGGNIINTIWNTIWP